MNLLDQFTLQHFQVSILRAELLRVTREGAMQDAKVEMNLTPRLMEMDSGDNLPSYQVSARLSCMGDSGEESVPAFKAAQRLSIWRFASARYCCSRKKLPVGRLRGSMPVVSGASFERRRKSRSLWPPWNCGIVSRRWSTMIADLGRPAR